MDVCRIIIIGVVVIVLHNAGADHVMDEIGRFMEEM